MDQKKNLMASSNEVTVLLATFNGEDYLEDQLSSIESQSEFVCKIYAIDNGSTDRTLSILNDFQSRGLVVKIGNCNTPGATSVFFELLTTAPEGEFVALSDQDDVWSAEKIKTLMNLIAHDKPAISFSARTYVDAHGSVIGHSSPLRRGISWKNAINQNVIPGNTMLLNPPAIALIKKFGKMKVVHYDSWIYLLISVIGSITYSSEELVLYRIHKTNSVGLRGFTSPLKVWLALSAYIDQAKLLATMLQAENIPGEQVEFLNFINDINQRNRFARLKAFRSAGIYRQTRGETAFVNFLFCIKLLLK